MAVLSWRVCAFGRHAVRPQGWLWQGVPGAAPSADHHLLHLAMRLVWNQLPLPLAVPRLGWVAQHPLQQTHRVPAQRWCSSRPAVCVGLQASQRFLRIRWPLSGRADSSTAPAPLVPEISNTGTWRAGMGSSNAHMLRPRNHQHLLVCGAFQECCLLRPGMLYGCRPDLLLRNKGEFLIVRHSASCEAQMLRDKPAGMVHINSVILGRWFYGRLHGCKQMQANASKLPHCNSHLVSPACRVTRGIFAHGSYAMVGRLADGTPE